MAWHEWTSLWSVNTHTHTTRSGQRIIYFPFSVGVAEYAVHIWLMLEHLLSIAAPFIDFRLLILGRFCGRISHRPLSDKSQTCLGVIHYFFETTLKSTAFYFFFNVNNCIYAFDDTLAEQKSKFFVFIDHTQVEATGLSCCGLCILLEKFRMETSFGAPENNSLNSVFNAFLETKKLQEKQYRCPKFNHCEIVSNANGCQSKLLTQFYSSDCGYGAWSWL